MATLEERIAVLEAMVQELRAQLEKPPRRDSLAKTYTCPCCGSGSFLGVREIGEYAHSQMVPMSLGNQGVGFWGPKLGDPLQAFVCKSCRYVEWRLARLEKLVADGKNVIELERPVEPPPEGDAPYR